MNGSDSSFCSFLSSSSHSKPELLSVRSEKRHSNEQSCVSKTNGFSDIPRDCYAPEIPGYSSFIGLNMQPESCVRVLLTSSLMGILWGWLNSHVKHISWLFGAEGVMKAARLSSQVLYREKCQSDVVSPTFRPHASHFAKLSLLSWISFFTIISFWNEKWMSGAAQIVI